MLYSRRDSGEVQCSSHEFLLCCITFYVPGHHDMLYTTPSWQALLWGTTKSPLLPLLVALCRLILSEVNVISSFFQRRGLKPYSPLMFKLRFHIQTSEPPSCQANCSLELFWPCLTVSGKVQWFPNPMSFLQLFFTCFFFCFYYVLFKPVFPFLLFWFLLFLLYSLYSSCTSVFPLLILFFPLSQTILTSQYIFGG